MRYGDRRSVARKRRRPECVHGPTKEEIMKHSINVALLIAGTSALHAGAYAADPAEEYPHRPVRFIVPFVPGAGTDLTTRTVAKKLTELYGQQFVADNRAGAGG